MKKNKIIGVDIDGVITKEGPAHDNVWHQALVEYLGKDIKRIKDRYNFMEAYNLPAETINDFLKEHLVRIYQEAEPAFYVKEILAELLVKKFKIYLITARKEKYNQLTKNWLKKHQIPYTKLFHSDKKAPLAQRKKIKLFIEDYEENIKDLLAYNIPVIIMNKYHNQSLKGENIYRVDNWQEIKEIVLNFFKN